MTDEEIIAAEAAAMEPDSITYMEAPVAEFENASTWADVAVLVHGLHLQMYLSSPMTGLYMKVRFSP